MKKSLVLAMAMALGVTASAYAANPFSDVPAGHWAYDSVNKLVAAGVVDGYPDGTYGGDKLMTRYEMAQIVAKAMAKGADVDKLAAEFADELDTLGVRVANLEKKADNVKVTGEVRYRYQDSDLEGYGNTMRNRVWVTGQVNDDWTYTGMIENVQDFGNDNGDEDTKFQRAYVEGKIGGVNVLAGRYNMFIADGNIYDTRADGVELSYGEKLKVTGFAGKATDAAFDIWDNSLNKDVEYNGSYGDYAGASVDYNMGSLKLNGGYINFKDMLVGNEVGGTGVIKESGIDNAIWYVGAAYEFDKNLSLSAMYLKGDMSENDVDTTDIDDDGYVIGLNYKGAKADEVGSWGLWAKYYDQGGQTVVAHTTDANYFGFDGFKGYGVCASYTFAKNIVGNVAWYDTENKWDSSVDDQRVVADLYFTF